MIEEHDFKRLLVVAKRFERTMSEFTVESLRRRENATTAEERAEWHNRWAEYADTLARLHLTCRIIQERIDDA